MVGNKNGGVKYVKHTVDDTSTVSETSESLVLTALADESDFYNSHEREVRNADTEKTMQRYIKKTFQLVKFLSDNGKNYKEPSFVQHVHAKKSQSVEICEYLWKLLGKKVFVFYVKIKTFAY